MKNKQERINQKQVVIKKSLSQNFSKAVDPENKIDVRAKLAETASVSTVKIIDWQSMVSLKASLFYIGVRLVEVNYISEAKSETFG